MCAARRQLWLCSVPMVTTGGSATIWEGGGASIAARCSYEGLREKGIAVGALSGEERCTL